jgi:hypothetical protein
MEFYSATKKNKILSFTSKWMELEKWSEVSQAQKAKNHMFSLICGLQTQNKCSDIIGHGSHTKGRTLREMEGNLKLESVWYTPCIGANKVILNWQRPLWEGDQEVVKRSGRDEWIQVVIHMYMEAMLGISLYSCLYLKLQKMLCLSYYLLCFLFNKIGQDSAWKQGSGGRGNWGWGGKMAQTMYTYMSKWINNKNKIK